MGCLLLYLSESTFVILLETFHCFLGEGLLLLHELLLLAFLHFEVILLLRRLVCLKFFKQLLLVFKLFHRLLHLELNGVVLGAKGMNVSLGLLVVTSD